MKKYYLIGLVLIAAVLISGCLLSGTITFTHELEGGINSIGSADTVHVDLSTESDYQDNKDKIKSIDAISVVGWIWNNGPDTNYAEIYLSDEADANFATVKVFESPRIAGNDSLFIQWSDGMSHIENFDALVDQIKGDGVFELIGQGEDSPFNIEFEATLVITFTVGS